MTAWVNSSLKKEQLAHCIETSKTNSVVCSRTLAYGDFLAGKNFKRWFTFNLKIYENKVVL